MPPELPPTQRLAAALKDARARRGWSQDELARRADVSLATIKRYELGKTGIPEPEPLRKLIHTLGMDPREIPVLLGLVTRAEMGLGPEPSRRHDASVEEVIAILEDPAVPDAQKREWIEYLRYRTRRPTPGRRAG